MTDTERAAALAAEIVNLAADLTGVTFWIESTEESGGACEALVTVRDHRGMVTDRDVERLTNVAQASWFTPRCKAEAHRDGEAIMLTVKVGGS